MVISRFDVVWVNLDPAVGHEIKKTRPCVVISPDEMNHSHFGLVIIAPLTSTLRDYPTRVVVHCEGKKGEVALDQMRSIDRSRVVSKMIALDAKAAQSVLDVLQEMFA
ncbi:MAG: type II toxin-antitoxin system PemK/MazF family toxin [Gammaproteobacteria bacterium]|jgi:mRNA interferase MazF|nr:type II toxin-antitoxin system PemK/MazF family toxin [Gammaproteobacteria bacterium]